jgi:hypothetical protein
MVLEYLPTFTPKITMGRSSSTMGRISDSKNVSGTANCRRETLHCWNS